MIMLLEGGIGSGKTTALCHYAWREEVIGGRTLTMPSGTLEGMDGLYRLGIELEEMVRLQGEGSNRWSFFFDESYRLYDSRHYGSPANRLFVYFMCLCKSRGNDVFITVDRFAHMDKRIRESSGVVKGRCFYSRQREKAYVDFSRTHAAAGYDDEDVLEVEARQVWTSVMGRWSIPLQ